MSTDVRRCGKDADCSVTPSPPPHDCVNAAMISPIFFGVSSIFPLKKRHAIAADVSSRSAKTTDREKRWKSTHAVDDVCKGYRRSDDALWMCAISLAMCDLRDNEDGDPRSSELETERMSP